MYEETKSSIDWKGIFLKVIIAFLIVLIAIKGYTTLKGDNDKKVDTTTTETVAESKSSSTFTENIEKLRTAGEKYYTDNKDKLPKTSGNTTMITLNELINDGVIEQLADEEGKTCDGESSYVTAILEGEKTKIKANLVCGSASSYTLVYMGENDTNTKETTTSDSVTSTTINNSNNSTSYTSNKKTESTNNCTSCATPIINVSTNTTANQTVNLKEDTANDTSNNKPSNNTSNKPNNTGKEPTPEKVSTYYRVRFDSNGGSKTYTSQSVKENNTAYNPGSTYRSGYYFIGWYLNGKKYDFSTPVTKDITLTAKFRNNDDYDDYDDYDDDYYYDRELVTSVYYSTVYTMGWAEYGTDYLSVDHTLKLPEYLEEKDDVVKVKISDITFHTAINTAALAKTYKNNHRDTFFYEKTGWETPTYSSSSLATIKSKDVDFDYSSRYKDIEDVLDEGYDVNWTADDVYKQCTSTFTVNNQSNNCNYGIVYKVKWTYQYYR